MSTHYGNPALEAELAYRREQLAAAAGRRRTPGTRWSLRRRRTR